MPFGPVVQALRDLHRRLDPATQTAVVGDAQPALARLLPELAGGVRADDVDDGAALFEHLLGDAATGSATACRRCSSSKTCTGPITRPATSSCSSPATCATRACSWSGRSAPTICTGAIRCGRCSPSSTGRAPRIALDLVRFDRDEIARADRRHSRRGRRTPDLVDATFERSDGNAFFAEELLAAEEMCDDTLPDSLRDIVLARVDALPDAAQRALRVVAVIGRTADYRLGERGRRDPRGRADRGFARCRRASGAHRRARRPRVPVPARARATRRCTTTCCRASGSSCTPASPSCSAERPDWFDGDEQSLASELACHWDAAHDQRRALPAALAAARAAAQMFAYPEALSHAERALDAVGARRRRGGADRSELRGHAAVHRDARRQLRQCRPRARVRACAALDAVDEETDPIEAGARPRTHRALHVVRELRARRSARAQSRRPSVSCPRCHRASSAAQVLATLGQQLMVAGRNPEAIETCEVCDRGRRAGGRPCHRGSRAQHPRQRAQWTRASSRPGRPSSRSRATSRSRPSRGATSPAPPRTRARTCRHSTGTKRRSRSRSKVPNTPGATASICACGAFLRINAGVSLYELGRWDEMEEQLREADAIEAAGVDELRGPPRVGDPVRGRGQFDAAEAQIQRGRSLLRGSTNAEVAARVRDGRSPRAGVVGRSRRRVPPARSMRSRTRVLASSCSDAGPALLAVAAAVSDDDTAIAAIVAHARPLGCRATVGRGRTGRRRLIRAQIAAELAPRPTRTCWRAVADAWAQSARIPNATYARYREAAAHVAVGDHRAAEETARDAYAMATTVGFVPIAQRIEALARAGAPRPRQLPWRPPRRPSASGLTAASVEVLALVARAAPTGRSARSCSSRRRPRACTSRTSSPSCDVANRGEAAAAAAPSLGLDRVRMRARVSRHERAYRGRRRRQLPLGAAIC